MRSPAFDVSRLTEVITEHTYNRHVKYCHRAQSRRKGRPKSCLFCSRAKAKCSFTSPCSRCDSKGLGCTYDQTRPVEPPLDEAPIDLESYENSGVRDANQIQDLTILAIDTAQLSRGDGSLESSIINEVIKSSLVSRNHQERENQVISLCGEGGCFDDSFLHLMTGDACLTTQNSRFKPAARLVHQMVMAFPQMMLRRQTFPPFIHPHWQDQYLPEALASCMSISQLFASRTPETRAFLWRTVDAEEKRFLDEAR